MRPRLIPPGRRPRWTTPSVVLAALLIPHAGRAQAPEGWRTDELVFHTFSIAAIDPETGEAGVAVTTRNACVGNGVPWVRAGVGAVATQAATRTEYGPEILRLIADGASAAEALVLTLADDPAAERRQIGVVSVDGGVAQHTGSATNAWAGHRSGPDFVVQGNLLEGPEVVDAVATAFEASRGSGRHLADRLIGALAAGQARGGDARKGRIQSAAVRVADPRDGMAQRPDGETVFIHVCEHPTPVAELRRIHDTVSGTLGYRTLQLFAGDDVAQLKIMLHALGFFLPGVDEVPRDADLRRFDAATVAAVDTFRESRGLSTGADGSPPGLVDRELVDALWSALAAEGKAVSVRAELRSLTRIRR